ncbi:beta-glucosidase 6 [Colletotrichum tofieldiae]|uniref:glucan 1,3-beta-glucosidase n=1 Tax=Colletotrichum tofieldiae TaxID=708197 RepID=A0A166LVV1_9PEZI|nr:beta-glucosidase 6 [Colletotrichum tofieldiae]GKT66333.1 beta-glucosidase 6 [Colletotrichum tofieldiae]GKT82110.1 beta-glucosidase 6 [Colletotrichum tofieldiae]GKT95446.1 beta-glucosidase 6 [Colletotrichum tofieldiae]
MAHSTNYNTSADDIVAKPGPTTDGEWIVGDRNVGKTERGKGKRLRWILVGIVLALVAVIGIVIGVLFAKNVIKTNSGSAKDASTVATASPGASGVGTDSSQPTATRGTGGAQTTAAGLPQSTASCSTPDDIPTSARGTAMDVTSWLDLTDFNCTFTSELIGGLPLVGLNTAWDDSKRANPNVPALDQPWGSYAQRPIRGVNIGGWLSLEPFITPSLFEYPSSAGVADEYTLCKHLGKDATEVLEKHYSTFVTEKDFKAIADAGLDHIRIPFSYWAVRTYDSDPYPAGLSWRYLLRGIEWARKYGLRIKLDLHGLPGSQNGWNHSGRQGDVGWLKSSNGDVNLKRSLDIHDQLSKFFAQDRYKNIVAFYGLANEPALTIPLDDLVTWTGEAYDLVRKNGVGAIQVFSESMKSLEAWKGKLDGHGDSLAIDVHQYTIFDVNVLKFNHADKIAFVCKTWTAQIKGSVDKTAGFGPTMVGEWSQADTDCTKHLNGMGTGARWLGTFAGKTTPACPTEDNQCSCELANADPSTYTANYKTFLLTWAEAQMDIFEKSWGWFYWTWKTESAPLWSYQAGLQGNFLPSLAYKRSWDCSKPIPSFGDLPEYY